MRQRDPATSVISECLRAQALARRRSRTARFFGARPLHPDSLPWYRGALGELEIAQRLGELGPEWHVLHSVPVGAGASDIDHVVIGPGGVFTINTKYHRGKDIWVGGRRILVGGQRTDHLRNARHEGARASQKLSVVMRWTVPVTPLIVFVGVRRFTIREHPADVVVLRDWELTRWLARQPVTLGHLEVAAVADAAAVPTTWHRTPSLEPADVAAFDELRGDVERARRRRTGWQIVALLALPVAMAAGANPFIAGVGSLVTALLAR